MSEDAGRRRVRAVWFVTALGTAVWLALIFLAPWLAARGSTGLSRAVYTVFAPVCHQIPGRCFALFGHPLAVCGRCLGIYAGFAAGLALYPLIRGFRRAGLPAARSFILATLPMAVDGLAGLAGLWRSPAGLRAATGLIWGALLPFSFVPGVADFFEMREIRRAAKALERPAGKSIE